MRLARYGRTFLVAVVKPAPITHVNTEYNSNTSVSSSTIVEYSFELAITLVSRCRSIDFLVYK
jgi:hypothetical protein